MRIIGSMTELEALRDVLAPSAMIEDMLGRPSGVTNVAELVANLNTVIAARLTEINVETYGPLIRTQ